MLNRLLVVITAQSATEAAVNDALDLAEQHTSSVLFVGLVPSMTVPFRGLPIPPAVDAESMRRVTAARIRDRIGLALQDAARRRLSAAYQLLDEPTHARALISLASAAACDAIVIGADRRSAIGRIISGSLIPGLITHAPMRVLVCKSRPESSAPRAGARVGRDERPVTRRTRTEQRGASAGLAGAPA